MMDRTAFNGVLSSGVDTAGERKVKGRNLMRRVERNSLVVVKWGMLGDVNRNEVYDGGGSGLGL